MRGLRRKSVALILVVMMVLMSFGGISFASSDETDKEISANSSTEMIEKTISGKLLNPDGGLLKALSPDQSYGTFILFDLNNQVIGSTALDNYGNYELKVLAKEETYFTDFKLDYGLTDYCEPEKRYIDISNNVSTYKDRVDHLQKIAFKGSIITPIGWNSDTIQFNCYVQLAEDHVSTDKMRKFNLSHGEYRVPINDFNCGVNYLINIKDEKYVTNGYKKVSIGQDGTNGNEPVDFMLETAQIIVKVVDEQNNDIDSSEFQTYIFKIDSSGKESLLLSNLVNDWIGNLDIFEEGEYRIVTFPRGEHPFQFVSADDIHLSVSRSGDDEGLKIDGQNVKRGYELSRILKKPQFLGQISLPDGKALEQLEPYTSYGIISVSNADDTFSVGHELNRRGEFGFGNMPDGDYTYTVTTYDRLYDYANPPKGNFTVLDGKIIDLAMPIDIKLSTIRLFGSVTSLVPECPNYLYYTIADEMDPSVVLQSGSTTLKEGKRLLRVGNLKEGTRYQLTFYGDVFQSVFVTVGFTLKENETLNLGEIIIPNTPDPIKLYGQLLDPEGNTVGENTGNYGIVQIEQGDHVFISDINPHGKFEFNNLPDGVYKVTYDIANLPLEFVEPKGHNIEIKNGILVDGSDLMDVRLQNTQVTAEIVKPDKTGLDESVFFEIFKEGEMRPVYSGMTKNMNGHQILKAFSLEIGESYYVQIFGSNNFGFPRPVNFGIKDTEIVDLGQIALDSIQLEVHVSDKDRAYAMVVIDKLTGFISYPGYTGYYPDLGLVKISGLATGFYNLFMISEGNTKLFATTSKPVQINNGNSKLQVLTYDMNTFQVSGKMSVKDGVPALNGVVVIRQNGKIVQKAPTNFDGYFALSGLKPGPYSATISVVDSGTVVCKPVYFKIQNDGSYSGKALQLNVTGFQEDRVIPDVLDKPVGSATETTITLNWSEGSDDVAVKGYEIYKNNVLVGETDQLDYVVTDLTPNKAYTFTIKTIDTSGNKSYNSTALRITTLKDVAKPSAITDLMASNTTRTTVELSWSPSTDNVGIKQYEVYRNGIRIKTTTDTAYKVIYLSPNRSYTFEVYAVDTSGNRSSVPNAVFVKTNK